MLEQLTVLYWLGRKQECFEGKNPFFVIGSEITVKFDCDVVVALTFGRGRVYAERRFRTTLATSSA